MLKQIYIIIILIIDIRYFFYIGGNDSMDTVMKLSAYVKDQGEDIKIIGIPKTIDNDVWGTETSFGFDTAVTAQDGNTLPFLDLKAQSIQQVFPNDKKLC